MGEEGEQLIIINITQYYYRVLLLKPLVQSVTVLLTRPTPDPPGVRTEKP